MSKICEIDRNNSILNSTPTDNDNNITKSNSFRKSTLSKLSQFSISKTSHSSNTSTINNNNTQHKESTSSISKSSHSPSRHTVPYRKNTFTEGFFSNKKTSKTSVTSLLPSRPSLNIGNIKDLKSKLGSKSTIDTKYYSLTYSSTVGKYWEKYDGYSAIGGEEISILTFSRKCNIKAPVRVGRIKNRLALIDLLRYEINQLTLLPNPRILRTIEPLEDSKEALTVPCEHIYRTLDSLVAHDGISHLESKLGALQIIEGLIYLHNSVHILHGNLTPSAIYITTNGLWKIGGFAFSVSANDANMYPCYPWTKKLAPELQPELDFLAPEYLDKDVQFVTNAADVFSFGVLICWIYTGGKRIIDAKNSLESYHIVVDQLDKCLTTVGFDIEGPLLSQIRDVLSKDPKKRPTMQVLALSKHFKDPSASVLRQLDDLTQLFDPSQKHLFLKETLSKVVPEIPESVWFSRIVQRFNQNLIGVVEVYSSILKPLCVMLETCDKCNINKLESWFCRIFETIPNDGIEDIFYDHISTIYKRLDNKLIRERCLDFVYSQVSSNDDNSIKCGIICCKKLCILMPMGFIMEVLVPILKSYDKYLDDNPTRQTDYLSLIEDLSIRCNDRELEILLPLVSIANSLHPIVVYGKARLVLSICLNGGQRLRNHVIITHDLLHPLNLGLGLMEMEDKYFSEILHAISQLVEQLQWMRELTCKKNDEDDCLLKVNGDSKEQSVSTSNLPKLIVSEAFSNDSRKMSFLSADGRLDDRFFRRFSKDSRSSIESECSYKLSKNSDVSDDSCKLIEVTGGRRRKGWLGSYNKQSTSFDQTNASNILIESPTKSVRRSVRSIHSTGRSRTGSPAYIDASLSNSPNRKDSGKPNIFTNLSHNLTCTLRNTFS
uniref:Protein kinase domain-containing protein n=1 Tax=Parastrongyloides trichosuri TaxID=131310 RepID=A0A0N4ZME1_PARTI